VGTVPDAVKSEQELSEDRLMKQKINDIRKQFEDDKIDVKQMAEMLNELRRERVYHPLNFEGVSLKSRTVFGR
jgi:hypothetical protein